MDERGPQAAGARPEWPELPQHMRAAAEDWLGEEVVSAASSRGGFSPGVAARLRTSGGRRVFVKAAGPEPNPDTADLHRREAEVVGALPREVPAPRLLWSHDEDGWMLLIFEDVDGRNPEEPWQPQELDLTLDALEELANLLTPSPLPLASVGGAGEWNVVAGGHWARAARELPARLDGWSARHLEGLVGLEADAPGAAAGDTLLHLDLRADNLLLASDGVKVVDWPHARVGAPWVDLLFFAPSVAMQGGPHPEDLLARYAPARRADPEAVTAVVAAIAGFFTVEGLRPAPPGLPTLRAFQEAQGKEAREWLARRTGWR